MKTPEQLDDFLTDVLYEALPKGMYRFWEIPNPQGLPAKAKLREYLTNWHKTQQKVSQKEQPLPRLMQEELRQMELKAIANWQVLCQDKFEEWSHLGPGGEPSPPSTAKFNSLKAEFLQDLEAILNQSQLRGSYSLEDPSSATLPWHIGWAPWSDQLNFDILFDTEIALYIMHYGWSS